MRVGYHGGESESIVLKRLTVAEIQKKATIENGVWQFGISEEFSIPKELLLCEKNGYYLSFLINDVNVEDNDDSYEYHPYYYGNSVRVYYHLEDTVIYFSPSYNPDKHELK